MDYSELYETWKRENESSELQPLNKPFFFELSEHIRVFKEELQMLDEKSLRAKLASEEITRTEKLVRSLIRMRFKKMFEAVSCARRLSLDLITPEEEVLHKDILLSLEKMKRLEKDILGGHTPKSSGTEEISKVRRNLMVRFLQDIPEIVGPNTKIYGPFKEEDIANLPVENAENLIKRGIALKVETE